ncbi:MAG: hypothetical protein QOH58_1005 [Thermoleophilaceae bacterium]|jgi:hypothetical protein|nr:hypothetical protein [Thermoleophilaceae bacterium]
MRWTLAGAAAVGLLLLLHGSGGPAGQGQALARVELAEGTLSLRSSIEGQAIFSADNIGPGHSASGTISVWNAGSLWGALSLSATDVVDTPGPGGGVLSQRLGLVVRDVTAVPGATVYAGPLDGLDGLPLGLLAPGGSREYSFTASLPHGVGDDAFEDATMTASYLGAVEQAEPPPPPPPKPPPPPDDVKRQRVPLSPRMLVHLPRAMRHLAGARMAAWVRCRQDCWLQARFSLPAGAGTTALTEAVRTGRLRAGRRTQLVFRVPARSLAALTRGRSAVALRIVARDAAGSRRVVERHVVVSPLRRR